MSRELVKQGDDKYTLLGVDWKEKHLGVPTWGWGLGLLALGLALFKGRR